MEDSSQALSCSQITLTQDCFRQDLTSIDESRFYVQCHHSNCLKWRRLNRENFAALQDDTEWDCTMNDDPKFNRCDVPEEKIVTQPGEFLIFSPFPAGELVYVKWTKKGLFWPALICPDAKGTFKVVTRNDDCDTVHYHVRFLGSSREHAWIDVNDIESYGAGRSPSMDVIKSHPKSLMHQYQQAYLAAEEMATKSREENLEAFTVPCEVDAVVRECVEGSEEFLHLSSSSSSPDDVLRKKSRRQRPRFPSSSGKRRQSKTSESVASSSPTLFDSETMKTMKRTGDPLLDESLTFYEELKRDFGDFMQSQDASTREE
ncbi:zinc finger CW-type PWWP domain protein 2-like isoform X2 [Oscarella lobularis]|uniref:zinc finger CW-type PWWP domain protein 2-like isoform X2 n=1 Tax=Oscarella lobularis TaxID=121494 RepID=UPI00331342EA